MSAATYRLRVELAPNSGQYPGRVRASEMLVPVHVSRYPHAPELVSVLLSALAESADALVMPEGLSSVQAKQEVRRAVRHTQTVWRTGDKTLWFILRWEPIVEFPKVSQGQFYNVVRAGVEVGRLVRADHRWRFRSRVMKDLDGLEFGDDLNKARQELSLALDT